MAMIPSGVKSPLRQWNYNAYTNNWVKKGNKITVEKPKIKIKGKKK